MNSYLELKLDKELISILKLINESIVLEDYLDLNKYQLTNFIKLVSSSRLDGDLYEFINENNLIDTISKKSLNKIKYNSLIDNVNTKKIYLDALSISRQLNKYHINHCFLKGIAMHSMVYEDIKIRPLRDIDLLVSPDEIDKAKEIIKTNGYAETDNHFFENDYLYSKLKNRKGTCIELHSRIMKTSNSFYDCEISKNILKNKINVKVDDAFINCPDLSSLTVHLLYHATLKENFDVGPIFIKDLLKINKIKKLDSLDYENLIQKINIKKISNLIFFIIQNFNEILNDGDNSKKVFLYKNINNKNLKDIIELLIRNPITAKENVLLDKENFLTSVQSNFKKLFSSKNRKQFLLKKILTFFLSLIGIIKKIKYLIKLRRLKNLK